MDFLLKAVRERLPLRVQRGYGWLKHQFKPYPQWEEEEFIRYYRWLEKTQWWSRHELRELQLEKLRSLVKHAYENVPYYRRIFEACKLGPEDIVTQDDLQKLPLLTKQAVRDNLEELVARNVDRSHLCYVTTSGSTGHPVGVFQEKHMAYLREMAFTHRQWSWAGYGFGDRFVTLRGNVLQDKDPKGARTWWRYDPGHNELILSSYDMTEENLSQYVQKINEFQPIYISAYPSSIEIFARFMRRNGFSNARPKAIFCESETLYPHQRRFIEAQFGCKIFAGYGLSERAVDAVECEQHQGYHVSMEYGIFELLDRFDEPIRDPDKPGLVVGTGFDTYGMPLIRYVTEDIAEYAPGDCRCHRELTLIKDFKGRLGEFIVSKCGKVIPLTALNLHSSIYGKIRELRYVQEREGELVVQIGKAPAFSEEEVEKGFLEEIYGKLDEDEFSVRIVFVDRVQRTGRGKLGLIEQKLPIKHGHIEDFLNATEKSRL